MKTDSAQQPAVHEIERKAALSALSVDGDVPRPMAVYTALRRGIFDGTLQPGDRLREMELAEALGVSRTPVREALQRLMADGLLQAAPGRGTVVADLDKQQVLELYAVREVLEGAAAAMAAQRADETDIAQLWALLDEEAQLLDDPDACARLNVRFHEVLNQAAHNRYLTDTVRGLRDTLALLRGTSLKMENRTRTAHEEHRALVSAIEERDPERAEDIARRHIRAARRLRMKMLYMHL